MFEKGNIPSIQEEITEKFYDEPKGDAQALEI